MPFRNARGLLALPVAAALALALTSCSSSSTKAATPTTLTGGADAGLTTTSGSGGTAKPVAARSAGCTAATPASPGQTTVHVTSDGKDRDYLRHVPPGYDATKPMPLVVDVHGYQEGAAIQTAMSGFGPYGDTKGFVTVAPDGLGPVPHWDTALGSADLKFIGAALDDVERALCIDTTRVYAAGLSQGAFMSSSIACEYADRFAAVAPVA